MEYEVRFVDPASQQWTLDTQTKTWTRAGVVREEVTKGQTMYEVVRWHNGLTSNLCSQSTSEQSGTEHL